MRRTVFLALVAALLLAPAAHAAGPIQIIRDCEDDGVLQGDYSASELRKARSNLPTDIDEYSDCRDVLSRAISAAVSSSGGGGNPSGSASGGTGGGAGSGTSSTGGGSGGESLAPPVDPIIAPSTPEDSAAIAQAAKTGSQPVVINGRAVSPGASRLAAHVGRNSLPITQLLLLTLLLGGALTWAGASLIRRRGLEPQP